MIASFLYVSHINLNAGFDSSKLCVITNLFCVHCVMRQFRRKQGQALMLILGDFLVVILILKKMDACC